ncbi:MULTISPECIES: DsbA family oxidoreductase [Oceanibaculum]|uniref:Polyketide biosynthesis dithiol-disulfide isomerase n=1 Tax=Oceanibaculum indicum P24 TaxID=1207063 RepID=K2KJZ2_9PROT|nr:MULTISPECIES: DsbA family oxidoreductase [Oceanibaculum]EKE77650.1 polyketide biosynthesis dithiol-disulfide isomerase [Oceanibaculum indicum P24]MCH2395434.1 DsbA family oxidoreductase [Oceanibaculum sp.]
MRLDIFSDVICPWCFIGKRRLERALQLRPMPGLEIRWRAFQLNPGMPKEGMDRQAYVEAKFGSEMRARQIYDTIRRVGSSENIPFDFEKIKRTPNTVDAHRLIRYAYDSQLQEPVTEALFQAYFLEGQDIGDKEVLFEIGTAQGLPAAELRPFLDGIEHKAEVEAECTTANRIGINGVPCFVLNGKYGLSGAQEPEALFPMFDLALQEEGTPAA